MNSGVKRNRTKQNWDCTTIYKFGNKKLVFIGCSHRDGHNKNFIRFIKNVIDNTKPTLAMVEYDDNYIYEISKNCKRLPKNLFSEKELVFSLANEYKYKVYGMDIERSKNIDVFTDKYIDGSKELAIFAWFLILMQQYRKQNKKKKYGRILRYEIYRNMFLSDILAESWLSVLGVWLKQIFLARKQDNIEECLDDIIFRMYGENIKKGMNLSNVKSKLIRTDFLGINMPPKHRIEEKFLYWNAFREASMINACVSQLKKHDSVIAIAGNTHVIRAREVLHKELIENFSNVKMSYWKDISASI